jgi:hypothetical protein
MIQILFSAIPAAREFRLNSVEAVLAYLNCHCAWTANP